MSIFRKFFAEKEEPTIVTEVEKPIINSEYIRKDMYESFEQVLKNLEIDLAREPKIDELYNNIDTFKNQNLKIYQKIEDLKSLGLVNTPSVKTQLTELERQEQVFKDKISKIELKIQEAKKVEGLIRQYSLKYPSFKFITRDLMIQIMKKYNLALADACFYGREIPQENLEVIKGFQKEIKATEKTIEFIEEEYRDAWGTTKSYEFKEKPKPIKQPEDFINYPRQGYQSFGYTNTSILKSFTVSNFKMIAPENHFDIPQLKMTKYSRRNESTIVEVPAAVINTETRMFEFNNKQIEELNKSNREVLDPIACLEVEGGYIVLSAWDECAEIPEIQNQNLN